MSTPAQAKPIISQIAELISASSAVLYPIIIIVLLFLTRRHAADLISVAIRKLHSATDIEFGNVKIKGALISQSGDVMKDDSSLDIFSASKEEEDNRLSKYHKQKHIMLVHTIKPSDPPEYAEKTRVLDVSVFLHSHKNFGKFNDIKEVSYYFGKNWGAGKFGSKFVVKNGNNQFAISVRMYGSVLCIAEVTFHSGEKIELCRYLDVEMAPVYGLSLSEVRY